MDGRIRIGVVVVAAGLLLAGLSANLVAQGAPESARPTEKPEAMTGLWEAPDGQGGSVVMEITLSALFENVNGPNSQPVYEELIEVALFERNGESYRLNYFASEDQSHSARWDGHRLVASFNARADQPKLRIDLTWKRHRRVGADCSITVVRASRWFCDVRRRRRGRRRARRAHSRGRGSTATASE